jgi:hypothetical protein
LPEYSFRERLIAFAWWLEGEGTFSYQKNAGPQIKVLQVQKWPLVITQSWFGGKVFGPYTHTRNATRPNNSPFFEWHTTGPRAIGLMMMVYQFLSPKRQEQIRLILRKWKLAAVYSGERTHCPQGHPYSGSNLVVYKTARGSHRCCRICEQRRENTRAGARCQRKKHSAAQLKLAS